MANYLEVLEGDFGQKTSTIRDLPLTEVVTHDGLFHADEIFAIALLKAFVTKDFKVTRTRKITPEMLNDPSIWVLDQGRIMDPTLHNFDHHHDKSLPSTVILVLFYLFHLGFISKNQYEVLRPDLINISNYDINGPRDLEGFHVNKLIKDLNKVPDGMAFSNCILFAQIWIHAQTLNVE